jgi:hypothetical protein
LSQVRGGPSTSGAKWYPCIDTGGVESHTLSVECDPSDANVVENVSGEIPVLGKGDGDFVADTAADTDDDSSFDECDSVGADNNTIADMHRFWESESTSLKESASAHISVKEHVHYWENELQGPSFIIDTIRNGYLLPLKSTPSGYQHSNKASAPDNAPFVNESILQLLEDGCIVEVDEKPTICSALSVVDNKSHKKRLVLNLRHLNKFLCSHKFKYDDLRMAMLLFDKGDLMFSFDLKSGYHHVDIAKKHWKYLHFSWGEGAEKQYFCFTVLPFGLSTACYLFTKVLRPLVKYWRSRGLKVIVYLDDGIGAARGVVEATAASQIVHATQVLSPTQLSPVGPHPPSLSG